MKILRGLLITLLLLMLSGAFAFLWLNKQFQLSHRLTVRAEVQIPRGATLSGVSRLLEEKKVITHARLFELYARIYGLAGQIKAGEYAFDGEISIAEVAKILVKGDVIVREITIPEGLTLAQIKRILENNPYLSGDITIDLKEGDVLPETYYFSRGESRNGILLKAQRAMQIELAKAFAERDKDSPLESERELLVLASIVEKETGLAAERGKVASVFVNRLNRRMKLQTDPTVIYALTKGEKPLGRLLSRRDLKVDSPYNTYLYEGLPPAPICSPGIDAIWAVARPEKTPFLYFVADGISGGHRFAISLAQHNQNVSLYRQQLRKY